MATSPGQYAYEAYWQSISDKGPMDPWEANPPWAQAAWEAAANRAGAAERARLHAGLDAVSDRYKSAGVFARCVVSDVRKLIQEPTP